MAEFLGEGGEGIEVAGLGEVPGLVGPDEDGGGEHELVHAEGDGGAIGRGGGEVAGAEALEGPDDADGGRLEREAGDVEAAEGGIGEGGLVVGPAAAGLEGVGGLEPGVVGVPGGFLGGHGRLGGAGVGVGERCHGLWFCEEVVCRGGGVGVAG